MRPSDIFDVCHGLYRKYRLLLSEGTAARTLLTLPGDCPSPAKGPKLSDYVADFDLAGRRALNQPGWELRHRLFQIYYVEDVSYRGTLKLLRIRPGVFE